MKFGFLTIAHSSFAILGWVASAQIVLATQNCTTTNGILDCSNVTLEGENFSAYPPGSLVNGIFDNADLTGANFAGQDLTGASFVGATLGPWVQGNGQVVTSFNSATLAQTVFAGAAIQAANFEYATFHCADFSSTNLLAAEFGPAQSFVVDDSCRNDFSQATIDVNAINTDNWGQSDFSYTDFQNVGPDTFNLQGKDITGAILTGAVFQNIDMTGSNLTEVDFTDAVLSGSDLTGAAANGIVLVGASVDFATLDCVRFYYQAGDTTSASAQHCTDALPTTAPTQAADLTSVNLSSSTLRYATMDYAVLSQSNLSATDFEGASLRHAMLASDGNPTTISGTIFKDVDFTSAGLNGVLFQFSNLIGAKFGDATGQSGGVTLQGTNFTGATMPNADFTNTVLENVTFSGAILQSAIFRGATLKSAGEGTDNSGVIFSCAQLGGSTFADADTQQASFANAVMPGPDGCCTSGGSTVCGTVAATGLTYGNVTKPQLTTPVICPDGNTAICSGDQWEIPNWTTKSCAPGNTSRVMWTPPVCGDQGPVVEFADPALEDCILSGLPDGQTSISIASAAVQRSVDCAGKGITDLGGLEDFVGLQSLNLEDNEISEFSFEFDQLAELKIGDNKLSSLDLQRIPGITWLEAENNMLQSVSLNANTFLQVLDVSGNALDSFDLAIQTNLLSADLSDNPSLKSVMNSVATSLSGLRKLSFLNLASTEVPTIGPATSIARSRSNPTGALTGLYLSCDVSFDCASLQLDASSVAYTGSGCAQLDQGGNWVPLTNPICPGN
ncbi:pentapeptide repeat-containing protein [uncultured Tateyamaria sp.]|uniref:pentapeptide repeat-containing protein n=1 Tax=uncultured Tateyamaria sp. TaxID=455651 RepID=UPI0026188E39|nr:pentapeptide repeat-containing protein [uncultured Tateyamaria sp.]